MPLIPKHHQQLERLLGDAMKAIEAGHQLLKGAKE
jgi:hypothetical protein